MFSSFAQTQHFLEKVAIFIFLIITDVFQNLNVLASINLPNRPINSQNPFGGMIFKTLKRSAIVL